MRDPGEECDTGPQNDDTESNACREDCTLPLCGDFVVDWEFGEECDQGSGNSSTLPDRCRENCALPACGDGVTDTGEDCDGTAGCSLLCTASTTCGNGSIESPEQCDDGNRRNGDGCSALCEHEAGVLSTFLPAAPECGDGILDEAEECDDGNAKPGDGCSESCTTEVTEVAAGPVCGNGIVEAGEECEPNIHPADHPQECEERCTLAAPVCGDGRLAPGEQCDTGMQNSDITPDACRSNCANARCGDSVVDNAEQCDPPGLMQQSPYGSYMSNPWTQSMFCSSQCQMQWLPVQMPLASFLPFLQPQPLTDTGPAALAAVAAGAASGWAFIRRRRW